MSNKKTLTDQITATDEGMRIWQQERTILEITRRICELMAEQNVSRSDLAEKLHRSRGYITQLLDGSANMTIRTISDVFLALDRQFHTHDGPVNTENDGGPVIYKLNYHQTTPAHFASKTQTEFQPITIAT